MDILTLLMMPLNVMVGYLVPFLIALTIIVFVHEFGHFSVARWCGVKVETFSIGFGKEVKGWFDRHGTRWRIAWVPLGGYVRFEGDVNAASQADTAGKAPLSPTSFHAKPVWQRALVVAAGPLANFILAILILAGSYMIVGVPMTTPRIDGVQAGSAADLAGLKPGDTFVSLNGVKVKYFSDVQEIVRPRAGETMAIEVARDGNILNLTLTPGVREESDGFGGKVKFGILGVTHNTTGQDEVYQRLPVHQALAKGTERTWFIISTTFRYLGQMVTGHAESNQLGGPIAIAKGAGDAASYGPLAFISFVAFLSVSIGLLNLFPIPMLDGGHLVFYAIEVVRGKPLGPEAQEWSFRVGFSLVLMLMVLGTFNDIVRVVSVAFGG